LKALHAAERADLSSKVAGKKYYEFRRRGFHSRCINEGIFSDDANFVLDCLDSLLTNGISSFPPPDVTKALYSAAISFCASVDLVKKGDQKTPGTFFEYLCAPILQTFLGVAPSRSLEVLNLDLKTRLPTDFIFDLGARKPKFHVPVKTSTRERIIQVFAHQRVLDGVYGSGRFLAMPMVMAETKTDAKTNEVTEICLPDQWRLYHLHIARFWKVVYFDLPAGYEKLSGEFPPIPVLDVGSFFAEDGPLRELISLHYG